MYCQEINRHRYLYLRPTFNKSEGYIGDGLLTLYTYFGTAFGFWYILSASVSLCTFIHITVYLCCCNLNRRTCTTFIWYSHTYTCMFCETN